MSRYSFTVPFGWFYVDEANAVAAGEVKLVRRFARDLILWRGEDGKAHLQDAYCPHLGANIGVGGRVVGNTIECPFHRWSFNPDGSVADIPYAGTINAHACLETYALVEKYGALMGWYHPGGIPPIYELPAVVAELETGDFKGPIVQSHYIRSPLQEMAENVVDGAHFQSIHGHPGAASYESAKFEWPRMIIETAQSFPSSRGPVEGRLSSESWGYGFAIVRYCTVIDICMLTVNAPVEADESVQLFRVYWKNPKSDERIDRIGEAFAKEVNRQLDQDKPIWENKIYRPRPHLAQGEGAIMHFRRWAQKFYPESNANAAASAISPR